MPEPRVFVMPYDVLQDGLWRIRLKRRGFVAGPRRGDRLAPTGAQRLAAEGTG
jgi:hypothetical protein